MDQPRRIYPDDPALPDVMALIRRAFAYMEARINPPSSMTKMTLDDARGHAKSHEIWAIGSPPIAACFLTIEPRRLYLGRLAVDESHRGQGLARRLFELAEQRAHVLNLPCIELGSRVELTENHAIFRKAGFEVYAEGTHDGFDRPTTLWFRKSL
ncbi:MAG: GNAT family N-acetyltransferase [Deltaproteobacteria bacterium]